MSSGSIPAVANRPQAGDRPHRRRRLVRRGDPSLADPGPRPDPLVGGVDHPLEVGVREDLAGRVPAPAADVGVARRLGAGGGRVAHRGSTSMSGCFALTRAPFSGTTLTTRPARSRLDLVEELHRLDQADDLADRDLAAGDDEWRGARRGRSVPDPGQGRHDARAGRRGGPPTDGSRRVGGAAAGAGRRRARSAGGAAAAVTAAIAIGFLSTRRVPPASTASSVSSLRSRSTPSRSTRARRDASAGSSVARSTSPAAISAGDPESRTAASAPAPRRPCRHRPSPASARVLSFVPPPEDQRRVLAAEPERVR